MKVFVIISGLILVFACILTPSADAKKIKSSFAVEKKSGKSDPKVTLLTGREIVLSDSLSDLKESDGIFQELNKISFVGFDKESGSNFESFIIKNEGTQRLRGFKVRVDYLDLQGRMLHSRTVEDTCLVPAGETRRIDVKSWDKQHTFYYYLGNVPRKVATPFKVKFHPISFRVDE